MDRKDANRVGIYKILRIIDRFQHVGALWTASVRMKSKKCCLWILILHL
jgi:hypothetical protein